jgi:long-chain acyl-CoA synthetase
MTSSPGAKEIRPADPLKALVAEISKADADRIQDGSDLRLDLGFDSLMLVELAGVLEESLGVSMDENQLANTQTFGDLAKAVQAPPILELPPDPPAWPRQRLARSLRRLIQRLLVFPAHRLLVSDFRVQGAGHLDRVDGPCLLIANHSSHVDTLSILRALPEERRATTTIAAAADYFFRNRILASLMALSLNLFPFSRRGNIRESLEFCGDLVDCGWSVLIYPEGTRSTTGELLDFKQGIGLLATGLKIPVVPIGVVGGHAILSKGRQFPRRGPVTLTIGAPITIDPESAPDQVTRRLEDSVRSLMTPPAQPGRRQKNEKEHA